MRKQTIKTALAALAALAVMLAAGCGNPLSPPDTGSGQGKPAVPAGGTGPETPGTGRITVRLAGNGARTLLPSAPVYDSYVIDFAGPAGAPAVASLTKDQAAMDAGVSLDVPEGAWTITVTGRVSIRGISGIEDGVYPAAKGQKSVTITRGENTDAVIDLAFSADQGEGALTYTVTLPAHAQSAVLKVLKLDGTEVHSFDLRTAPSGSAKLNSGYYLVQAAVDGYGSDKTVKTEILHIYQGLTTAVTLTSDFGIIRDTVLDPAAQTEAFTLTGKLTAPVADAAIQSGIDGTEWYTGALTWSPAGVLGYYGFGVEYTAALILTPAEGLTFGAVSASSFSYTGGTVSGVTANSDGTVRVTVTFAATASLDHTGANDETKTDPGLYIGARTTPKSGVDTLAKAFTWIAGSAVDNGKYRYVLDADESQAAKTLNAAAFNSKTGVVLTLAGDTQERTIQLTGTGSLYTVNASGNTLRLGNYITLKGVTANTGALAVVENGSLVMEADSKITGNIVSSSANGAGVRLTGSSGAAFTMNGGEISDCKNTNASAYAGGVFLHNGSTVSPVFTMNGGTITNNTGSFGGGVNVSTGVFTMVDGAITGNNAGTRRGGGVLVGGNAAFTMQGGTISGNTAAGSGGGVTVEGHANNPSDFIMEGGTIAGNTVTGGSGTGGGVHINSNGRITKTGGTIYGSNETTEGLANTAASGPAVYIATTTPFARKTTLTGYLTKAAGDTTAIPSPQDNTGVATVAIAADGTSGSATSTTLIFTFSQAVAGFAAANITLTGTVETLPTLGTVSEAASPGDGTVWEAAIDPVAAVTIGAVIDHPGVTLNPVAGIAVHDAGPATIVSVTQAGGTSALTNTASIKIVFSRALAADLAVDDISVTAGGSNVTLGALTQDSSDSDGKTYLLALSSVSKESDIELTIDHDDVAETGTPPANVKTLRVFKDVTHSATHASVTVAGLYAGDMDVPVQFGTAPANTGAALLTSAFAWVKDNARANGNYRIVLGADVASPVVAGSAGALSSAGAISTSNPNGTTITDPVWKEAWNLDATAFHATGVTITLAGDTAERTIQLTGTGQLFKIAGGTLRLDNHITLKGISSGDKNTGGVLVLVADTGKLIMETGSKITGNTVPNTVGGEYVGGGVLLYETAEFTMNGGEISGHRNEVTWGYNGNGGGLNMRYGSNPAKLPTFTMNGGTIKNNFAKYGGGVMVVAGTFTMTGSSSIQGNEVSSWGGGVGLGADGSAGGLRTFNMQGGSITGNKSTTHGGGVYINSNGNSSGANSGYLNMTGGTISGNLAAGNGGGVWINTNGKIAKTGGVIHGSNAGTDDLKNRTVESLTNLTDVASKGAAVWVATTTAVGLENTVDTDHNLTKAPTDSASVPGGSGWSG